LSHSGFIFQHRDAFAGDQPGILFAQLFICLQITDLDKILSICEQNVEENPAINWSNKTMQKEWSEVIAIEDLSQIGPPLIATADARYSIFIVTNLLTS
jgi:hypothetical protein